VFDQFFLAAPFWASPISKSLTKHFEQRIPKQGYVKLHVTFLTTRQETPDPAFFLQAADFTVPTTILTTSYTAKAEGSEMPFQSITYHGETTPGSGEWVVKIFSLKPLEDYTLTAIFGDEPTWVHRKTWLSYPKIRPISAYASVEPIPGFHYLASLEPWVST
jgi:prenylcysteine oxidase/farnesylcysteine lyase